MPVFRNGDRSILFVHIPKTGGTSIEQLFKASGWDVSYLDGRYGPGSLNNLRWCGPQHLHGEPLQALFRLDRFEAVFAVVRDPVARFRSEYVWRTRKDEQVAVDADSVERWFVRALASYRGNHYLWDNHLRPQHEFLVPGTRVLRFEDGLQAGLEALDRDLGLGLTAPIEHHKLSRTTGRASSDDVEVSAATRRRIARFYAGDFRRFGYPRG